MGMQKAVKQRILIVAIFALIMLAVGGLAIASHTQDASAQQDLVTTKTATQTKTAQLEVYLGKPCTIVNADGQKLIYDGSDLSGDMGVYSSWPTLPNYEEIMVRDSTCLPLPRPT